ncbi:MAG: macrolide family glycosyltransferase [Candidatus Solibacter sp.]
MKALFLSLPLHGHTNPALPLMRELTRGGDEVVCFSNPLFAEKLAQAGAVYRPYRHAGLAEMNRLPERMEELTVLLMQATGETLRTQLEEWRALRPDYLLADSVAPWGHWAGKLLQVPLVTSVPTLAINRRVMSYGLARGMRPKSAASFIAKLKNFVKASGIRSQIKREFKVDGPGVIASIAGCSGLNIVYTSRYFQPCEESFDATFHFVGPSVAARAETVDFPWDRVQSGRVVYISMGTLFNENANFYRACFEAWRGENCQVILSTGANVALDDLGPPPENFIVRPYVPQLEVLARAGAFVSHGGMNSVNESLMHGVPLLVIPQMGEQYINGRRVEELKAGLLLSNAEAGAARLRHSVRRLLDEPQFREGAAAVRQSYLDAGGVARAAQLIRAFTRRA